jgi:hypothetical protein
MLKKNYPLLLAIYNALSLLHSGLTTEAIIELEKIKNTEGNYSIDSHSGFGTDLLSTG